MQFERWLAFWRLAKNKFCYLGEIDSIRLGGRPIKKAGKVAGRQPKTELKSGWPEDSTHFSFRFSQVCLSGSYLWRSLVHRANHIYPIAEREE